MSARNRHNYLQAKKLAKRLGCDIEIDRHYDGWPRYNSYWAHGPARVYGSGDEWELARKDPWEGNHCHTTWAEVLFALEVYQRDMHWHELGIGSEEGEALDNVCDKALLTAWVERPDEADRGLVLADWLEEAGHLEQASLLRAAVAARSKETTNEGEGDGAGRRA